MQLKSSSKQNKTAKHCNKKCSEFLKQIIPINKSYQLDLTCFVFAHFYITALWHLASVVSMLEHVYGFVAMKKSYDLWKGRVSYGAVLDCVYLLICGVIGGMFSVVVVHGVFSRVVICGFLVGVLVIVNLVGMLV